MGQREQERSLCIFFERIKCQQTNNNVMVESSQLDGNENTHSKCIYNKCKIISQFQANHHWAAYQKWVGAGKRYGGPE